MVETQNKELREYIAEIFASIKNTTASLTVMRSTTRGEIAGNQFSFKDFTTRLQEIGGNSGNYQIGDIISAIKSDAESKRARVAAFEAEPPSVQPIQVSF